MSQRGLYRLLAFVPCVALLWTALPASAIPPPKKAEELEKDSDAVVTVRVLGVICTGEVTASDQKVNAYQAWLLVTDCTKGKINKGDTILVGWRDIPKGIVGDWQVAYLPGEEVKTHLKWNADAKAYTTTWWNAKDKPTKEPDEKKLPAKPGEMIWAKSK